MENRICPLGLEEREVGSFRNLTWLCLSSMMAGGAISSTVRCEEMGCGQDVPDQDPHVLPSFHGVGSISGKEHFNRSGFQQSNAIPVEFEQFSRTQGC